MLDGDDKRRQRGFHVGGAAAIQESIADRRRERVGMPGFERSRRHDVGVPRETQRGPRVAASGPEVGHPVGRQRLAAEVQGREPGLQELLAARIIGRLRTARDQLAREVERGMGTHRRRCLRFHQACTVNGRG